MNDQIVLSKTTPGELTEARVVKLLELVPEEDKWLVGQNDRTLRAYRLDCL